MQPAAVAKPPPPPPPNAMQVAGSSGPKDQQLLDDSCGTPSRRWPWPGPPPWVWQIASQLLTFANSLPAGTLHDDILDIAGQAVDSSIAKAKTL
jgi:hypothetical protein